MKKQQANKPVSGGCYRIAVQDGRVMEVADFNCNSGAPVQLWANADAESQKWLLTEVLDGWFKVENKLSGKVLDVVAAGTGDGAWVHQWDYLANDNQLWAFEPVQAGWKIRSKASGKVLDVVALCPDNGARLQIWEDVNGDSQIWTLTALELPAAEETVAVETVAAPAVEEVAVETVTAPAVEEVAVETVTAPKARGRKPAAKKAPAAPKAPAKKPGRKAKGKA